jgi:hypothetical protein
MKLVEITRDEYEEYLTGSKSKCCEYFNGNVMEEGTGNILAFMYDFGTEIRCYKVVRE